MDIPSDVRGAPYFQSENLKSTKILICSGLIESNSDRMRSLGIVNVSQI
jgi:hypothetical protein